MVSRQHLHQITHPEKTAARKAVYRAIRAGKLVPPDSCERCGQAFGIKCPSREAHHANYTEPLTVQWLCSWCHSDVHPHGPNAPKF